MLLSQIAPFRIELINKRKLPCAPPALQTSFARPSFGDRSVLLEINQANDAVFTSETRHDFRSMLKHPAMEVVRHADIENAIAAICHNVDEVPAHRTSPT